MLTPQIPASTVSDILESKRGTHPGTATTALSGRNFPLRRT